MGGMSTVSPSQIVPGGLENANEKKIRGTTLSLFGRIFSSTRAVHPLPPGEISEGPGRNETFGALSIASDPLPRSPPIGPRSVSTFRSHPAPMFVGSSRESRREKKKRAASLVNTISSW